MNMELLTKIGSYEEGVHDGAIESWPPHVHQETEEEPVDGHKHLQDEDRKGS